MSPTPLSIWLDGELRPLAGAHVSMLDQGLHYGCGVFEGLRGYAIDGGCAVFRLDDHLARMARGAEALGFTLDADALRDGLARLMTANALGDAYLRPIAWLGDGQGVKLDISAMQVRHAIATLPLASHLSDAVRRRGLWLQTSRLRRNPHDAIPPLKLCGAYVNSVIAKTRAMRDGFDQALFLDGDRVVEGAAENVMIVRGGRFIAVDHPDALPGITLQTLIELTGAERRAVTRDELLDADEVLLCGTSAEVCPVTRLDDRAWPIGPLTLGLRDAYADLVRGRDPSREAWITRYATGASARKVA